MYSSNEYYNSYPMVNEDLDHSNGYHATASNYYNYGYNQEPYSYYNNQQYTITQSYNFNYNGTSTPNHGSYEQPNSSSSSSTASSSFLNSSSSSNSPSSSTSTRQQAKNLRRPGIHHQPLPEEAVDILNDWYETHINHPYPTTDEKQSLAEQCNLTVKQVNSWFCNRRNRSQNTKPKRVKRQLQEEISTVFNELITNTNNSQVMEKIFNLLS